MNRKTIFFTFIMAGLFLPLMGEEYLLIQGLDRDASMMAFRGLMFTADILDMVSAPIVGKNFNYVHLGGAVCLIWSMYEEYLSDDIARWDAIVLFWVKFSIFLTIVSLMNMRIDVGTTKLVSAVETANGVPVGESAGLDKISQRIREKYRGSNGVPYFLAKLNNYCDEIVRKLVEKIDQVKILFPDLENLMLNLKFNSTINKVEFGEAINSYVKYCLTPAMNRYPDAYSIDTLHQDGITKIVNYDIVGKFALYYDAPNEALDGELALRPNQNYNLFAYPEGAISQKFQSFVETVEDDGSQRLLGSPMPVDTITGGLLENACSSMMEGLVLFAEQESRTIRSKFGRSARKKEYIVEDGDSEDTIFLKEWKKGILMSIAPQSEDVKTWIKNSQAGEIDKLGELQLADYFMSVINLTFAHSGQDTTDHIENKLSTVNNYLNTLEKVGRTAIGDELYHSMRSFENTHKIINNGYIVAAMLSYVALYLSLIVPGYFLQKFCGFLMAFLTIKLIPVTEAFVTAYMRWVIADNLNMKDGAELEVSGVWDVYGTSQFLSYNEAHAYMQLLSLSPLITVAILGGGLSILSLSRGMGAGQGGAGVTGLGTKALAGAIAKKFR